MRKLILFLFCGLMLMGCQHESINKYCGSQVVEKKTQEGMYIVFLRCDNNNIKKIRVYQYDFISYGLGDYVDCVSLHSKKSLRD